MLPRLRQLSKHIWLLPHSPWPGAVRSAVGVIAGQCASVLVDAGNSPRLARHLARELVRCGLPPVSRIIYTHHHWDHVYGACAFAVPITGHVRCRALLEHEARKPWSAAYLREQVRRNPRLKASYRARARAIQNWQELRILPPDDVFETQHVLDLEGMPIALRHVGGNHAEDSIVVMVPGDSVMFIGDCYYPPPLHQRTPASAASPGMLRQLQHDSYRLYVEGHGKPLTATKLLQLAQR